jgi:hypothetical protein
MPHLHTDMKRFDVYGEVCESVIESATIVAMPPCPSVQILRPNSIHRKPLMIDDKLQDLGELVGRADS